MTSATPDTYLIVGAGVFGAATALELRKRLPASRVLLLDRSPFPNPFSASSDLNKIIRADYPDPFYMGLALAAQTMWRNGALYPRYYNQPGMLYVENQGMAQTFRDNYAALGVPPAAQTLDEYQARFQRWGGLFRNAHWHGAGESFYFNPHSGWADADGALRHLTQAAIDAGAEHRVARVAQLILEGEGEGGRRCRGVRLEDGSEIYAHHVVVAAGAWTPKLLADSAPGDEAMHAGERMVAAGAIQCVARVPAEQAHQMRSAPVIFNAMGHTQGTVKKKNRIWKDFNYESSFTNYVTLESGLQISVPPAQGTGAAWNQDVPQTLKDEIHTVVKHTFGGRIQDLQVESYRMCWDAVTPNQDWIIAPHPHCQSLYIASGGSFHSWKFMPILGRYVVKMLLGQLGADEKKRWAWDREDTGGALPEYIPKRDLKDIP
ncbi:sarcosine oxidase [Cordyceps militaris CM01]|uniref:Sarcosine oxidase n=1 Tax=Cordyceps militaris (strain CM01) TaxID=983644 RepID=G3JFM5_CORMM|nr:sarcosine oxidase [Cordyceps militaris CM01]EGX93599.1 sarcosine oxidase [Cordyceps militaris CM01]